eukprot:TRINITY_DN9382_c0_g1::TRINITY_DN9382_c0_g1_i1::g.28407::m.28407 TRINITY_DN9382_c0_g1::TRINITY_DN9382_c0_g1_i1::g.28407  ORF type:complete len:190 (+),score=7.03,sp/Q5PQ35/MARH2_XENLA/39.02/7e-11,RINGv/PF12906.2/1.4e-10,RINGv/PF12906.2/1.4e+04,Baculo_IE-1/PF05290.6/0.019,Baculo_IE-1/PF05290.6/1.3e+03,PBP1_TM/PF14812.1/0.34 TRINITY_DN9382_c0_g1_i1:113-682(+)
MPSDDGEYGDELERAPLLGTKQDSDDTPECRICFESDKDERLCSPCKCCGHLKWTHPSCLQRWVLESGSGVCEICRQPFSTEFVQLPHYDNDGNDNDSEASFSSERQTDECWDSPCCEVYRRILWWFIQLFFLSVYCFGILVFISVCRSLADSNVDLSVRLLLFFLMLLCLTWPFHSCLCALCGRVREC